VTTLPDFFGPMQAEAARALAAITAPAQTGTPVDAVVRYTLEAPSKRVRAVLVWLSADICGAASRERATPAACAVEMIHAASLLLDDLPCMDDAPLRRGRPTAHRVHGEAPTILAAFALLNEAFAVIARAYEPPVAASITRRLTSAVGLDGLVAGQAEDLLSTGTAITFATLERIHRRKTGVLFSAAAEAGALSAGGAPQDIAALSAYAKNLGLAFQIVDDLLDVTGSAAETGKATRSDARKMTFVSFSGVEGARALSGELCEAARAALAPFGERAARLHALATFVSARRT
jgi:geranylgeranyl pyrophosphate synthase